MEMKRCTKCDEVKCLSDFSRSTRRASTFRGAREVGKVSYKATCKACDAAYNRAWRMRNPQYQQKARKRRRDGVVPEHSAMLRSFVSCRVSDAKARAAAKGLPFDLDNEYMLSLWDGVCSVSEMPINCDKGSLYIGSIDKIDPDKGYVRGNVQWVSWQLNRAKGEYPLDVLITMCRAVLERAETIRKE